MPALTSCHPDAPSSGTSSGRSRKLRQLLEVFGFVALLIGLYVTHYVYFSLLRASVPGARTDGEFLLHFLSGVASLGASLVIFVGAYTIAAMRAWRQQGRPLWRGIGLGGATLLVMAIWAGFLYMVYGGAPLIW